MDARRWVQTARSWEKNCVALKAVAWCHSSILYTKAGKVSAMAHPYESSRSDKVERSRVGKMFGPECRIERACGGDTVKKRGRGGAMRYAEEDPGGDPQAAQPKQFLSKLKS